MPQTITNVAGATALRIPGDFVLTCGIRVMNQDRLFAEARKHIEPFVFDDAVADVFDDMIARSVPGYASMLATIELITKAYATADTQLYDLGCSLGAATRRMRVQAPSSCTLHAVDSSPAMIRRLRETLAVESGGCLTVPVEADIRDVDIHDASVVVLNLTLQFLPPEERGPLLQRIRHGMREDGVLVLSEKICFDDPAEQQLMTDLYHDFKRAHGYSDLEIAQKRTALENRLVPETLDTHLRATARLWISSCRRVVSVFQFRVDSGTPLSARDLTSTENASELVWKRLPLAARCRLTLFGIAHHGKKCSWR